MATTISKAEFDTLPDSLKSKFQASGDSYILQEEDVEGLKKSKADILAEKKAQAEEIAELKKYKAEVEAAKSLEDDERARKAGEFEQIEKRYKDRIAQMETDYAEEKSKMLGDIKRERLMNELTKRGVLPDRAKYAFSEVDGQVELIPSESGFSLKVKDGIGDAKEFDSLIEGLKTTNSFFFKSDINPGGGAPGSEGKGSGKSLDGLSATQKLEQFYSSKN